MTNPLRVPQDDVMRRGGRRPAGAYGGRVVEPTEDDPLFVQALGFLQQAQWAEAQATLIALEQRYPGSSELARMRQLLALRLSAEETWGSTGRYRLAVALRKPAVRGLIVANFAVYALLGVAWMIGQLTGLLY